MILPKIEQPIYDLTIPSNGQPIKIRPMLAKEEKLLLMAKESEDDNDILGAIKQVVNNCILTENVDIDRLAIFDLEFIFLRLRAFSASNTIEVGYRDNEDYDAKHSQLVKNGVPEAKAVEEAIKYSSYSFKVDLNQITVQGLDQTPDNMIPVNDHLTLRMRRPSASLYTNKEFLNADSKAMLDLLIYNCIDAVVQDGNVILFDRETPVDQKQFLEDLPIPVMDKVREYLANQPSIYHEINYTNKNGKERKIQFRTLNDFFTLR
ncbi:MAG TPA: hypothetical protein VEP90_05140 [Methylomirabilota bacterium]|nr:hypothetical protein [Methylomirabilota bacterium]